MTTTRPATLPASQRVAQDLAYYYDPAANITRIRDTADTQDVIFFRNQRVEPSAGYTYDPLYRLTAATGREHLGQTGGALSPPRQITNDDAFRTGLPQPGDGNAMGTYTETYTYDPAGNLLTMAHQVSSGSWTRRYAYTSPSQITVSETSNRLTATSLPGDPASGPFHATYTYDPHGNMLSMPHLAAMAWDEQDHLRSSTRQPAGGSGTPQTTYYTYDATGQRVAKATDGQAAKGQTPVRRAERIYLGAVELYREFATDGTTVTLQRETLHIEAASPAVTLAETRTIGTDSGAAQLTRYQHANHLGSAVLELDDKAQIITYEEYFPYGSTSYQAVRSKTETPKRYRYTGKERDEENDLSYHGARYYAPWLGRWTTCDPVNEFDQRSPYAYVSLNPPTRIDPDGADDLGVTQQPKVLGLGVAQLRVGRRELARLAEAAEADVPGHEGITLEQLPSYSEAFHGSEDINTVGAGFRDVHEGRASGKAWKAYFGAEIAEAAAEPGTAAGHETGPGDM